MTHPTRRRPGLASRLTGAVKFREAVFLAIPVLAAISVHVGLVRVRRELEQLGDRVDLLVDDGVAGKTGHVVVRYEDDLDVDLILAPEGPGWMAVIQAALDALVRASAGIEHGLSALAEGVRFLPGRDEDVISVRASADVELRVHGRLSVHRAGELRGTEVEFTVTKVTPIRLN